MLTDPPYSYANTEEKPFADHFSFSINVLDPHNWHTMKHYNHYFMTVVFTILAILFFLRFWEISDYSNRDEVKNWLDRYIADGWWRKGAYNIARVAAKSLLYLALFLLILNAIVRSFAQEMISNGLILSTMFVILVSATFMIWLCGYIGIKVTEAAFERYESQNVAYTSAIILKRAVKAKLDFGLIMICAMFIPFVYTILQGLLSKFELMCCSWFH